MSLRVLLADHHVLFLQALGAVLRKDGLEVVGEAFNARDAVEHCRRERPDVAILGVSQSPFEGIGAAREILRLCPKTRIVILGDHVSQLCVRRSLHAGIDGFVLKTDTGAELVRAVRAVSRGEKYVAPSVSCVLGEYPPWAPPQGPLSVRECHVLQMIAEGKGNKEIADILGISTETARSHRKHIMKKLDIRDTAKLVRYSVYNGLLEGRFGLQKTSRDCLAPKARC